MIDISTLTEYILPEPVKPQPRGFIYLLCYKGIPIYVGASTSLESRIRTHIKEGTKPFDKVLIMECPVEELRKTEHKVIMQYRPIFSSEYGHKPLRPFQLIDDIIFCAPPAEFPHTFSEKFFFKLMPNGTLSLGGKIRGFLNGKNISYFEKNAYWYDLFHYDFEANVLERERKMVSGDSGNVYAVKINKETRRLEIEFSKVAFRKDSDIEGDLREDIIAMTEFTEV